MKISYVIVTCNRAEALLKTLEHLKQQTPLESDQWEVFVVDNASTDDTIDRVRARFPKVMIIERSTNEGAGARSYAFGVARGQYIVLLDDDSYPVQHTIARSMAYLDATPKCGAVVGRVVLPDGTFEACALPNVMLSGAVMLRRTAVQKVGGFRREFFRKAGEYDYSFRFWQAGYSVERFEDIVYKHDKVMTGRSSALAHRMDLRNNLIIVERFYPTRLRAAYRRDVTQRYVALARKAGQTWAARRALIEAKLWRAREWIKGRQTLRGTALESALNFEEQHARISEWSRTTGIKSVVVADFSKSLYATMKACEQADIDVWAIADDNPAFAQIGYRGTPVKTLTDALSLRPHGIILSNVNPAQVQAKADAIRQHFAGPLLTLWRGRLWTDWDMHRRTQALERAA
jgi:GT2 family glycosyltransferase